MDFLAPAYSLHQTSFFPLLSNMSPPLKEARVVLALEALRNDEKLRLKAIAKLYNIPALTLRRRRAGKPVRCDTTPNSRNLTDLEEQIIV